MGAPTDFNRPRFSGGSSWTAVTSTPKAVASFEEISPYARVHSLATTEFNAMAASFEGSFGRIAYVEVSGEHVNASYRPDAPAVGIILKGKAQVHARGGAVEVTPGRTYLGVPGDDYVIHGTDVCSLTWVLPGSLAVSVRTKSEPPFRRRGLGGLLPEGDSSDFFRLLHFLASERDRQLSGVTPAQTEAVGKACVHRLELLLGYASSEDGDPNTDLLTVCTEAERYVRAHLHRRVTAQEVSNHCCCSVRQLYRSFELVGGTTPRTYFQRLRLLLAKAELLDALAVDRSDLRHLALNYALGSAAQFCSLYATEFGEHPAETVERRVTTLQALERDA